MPRACTVCIHTAREQINHALVAAESYRGISRRFAVSEDALLRHRMAHLPVALVAAEGAAEVASATTLLAQVQHLHGTALRILVQAEQAGDLRTALLGIGQARGCLELLAKLEGELDERPVVNVLVSPEWVQIRSAVLSALQPYPEARADVATRLLALEMA